MKIVTFNVNSINARMEGLSELLRAEKPDVALLQEIKTEFDNFPFFELNALGYGAKIIGQKSYNGVAILSPHKIEIVQKNLPDFTDVNARYLEAKVHIKNNMLRVASIYLPNGNPPYNNPDDGRKFEYKLQFMEALYERAKRLVELHENVILGGDFNTIFTDFDVYNPGLFRNNALFREEVKQRFAALCYLGYYDAFRALYKNNNGYTYWDYSGGAFAADLGMRIDYLLLSATMADRLKDCRVMKNIRAMSRPSDHAPLLAEFEGF